MRRKVILAKLHMDFDENVELIDIDDTHSQNVNCTFIRTITNAIFTQLFCAHG